MIHEALFLLAIGTAAMASMMLVLWLIHLRMRNAGIVDIGWAFGLGILGVLYATLGSGDRVKRWTGAGMVAIWSLRLGSHLAARILGHPEEGRYKQLRQEWAGNINVKFLVFFEAQAVLDVILSLPFILIAIDSRPGLSLVHYLAIGLWLIAVIGEAVADAQLAAFKKDPSLCGQVCDVGFWNYSRHPNYFFEWLVWVAWALFSLPSPLGWLSIVCPALMLFFLFRITGVPATEAQALRSKGGAYSRYQQTTSVFIPWFRKSIAK